MEKLELDVIIKKREFTLIKENNCLVTRSDQGDGIFYTGHYEIMARVTNEEGGDNYYPIKVVK
jgi:hypothetical protein